MGIATVAHESQLDAEDMKILTKPKKKCPKSYCLKRPSLLQINQHICSPDCSVRWPLHHLARIGRFKELKVMLDDPNCVYSITERDLCRYRTPLHYASSTGSVEKGLICIKLLLQSSQLIKGSDVAEKVKDYVNEVDDMGETALHLAAKNEATKIVIDLLCNQARFDIQSCEGVIPLSLIYKLTPDAMNEVLNQSITYVENCGCEEGEEEDTGAAASNGYYGLSHSCAYVCLDFGPVIGYDESSSDPYVDVQSRTYTQETNFLYQVNRKRMAPGARGQILTNILVKTFLEFKWDKIKWFCYIAILAHLIWLSLYIWTSISIFALGCPFTSVTNATEDSLSNNRPCQLRITTRIFLWIVIILSFAIAVKECFQMCRLRSLYIRFENLGQVILLILIFTSAPVVTFSWELRPMDYQISAFGIFLAWTLTLCQLAKIPRFKKQFRIFNHNFWIKLPDHGVYVEILSRVFKKFLVFITIFSSLLIAFAFSFSILLPEKQEFSSFPLTMIKVLTMMTGELNYLEVFHNEDGTKLIYHASSHILYLIFVVVATIILFNLLIGFTVSDIQGLQKKAQINQISSKLEQIFLMESFLLSTPIRKLIGILCGSTGEYQGLLNMIMVVQRSGASNLCYHTKIQALPYFSRVKIRDLASRNCMAISEMCETIRFKLSQKRSSANNSSSDSSDT